MYIKPAHIELKVPDPERKDFLPPDGREVNPSAYWTRCQGRKEITIENPIENNSKKKKDNAE